ncbi:MAG: hypothetical protein FJ272_20710 [Planctomycetes bacterium]|nr:hypothetical protein [Planctomycetota bacterium]
MAALIEAYKETWDPEYRRIIDAFFEHFITKEQNTGQDPKKPLGSFPQWENYAPWLERYCDLTGDPRARKALVAWADAYLEGYGDACSTMIGEYVNIMGYAYLVTRDPKYLGRGVWEAKKALRSVYAGDDPLLKGLMQLGQTSHGGYMIQRLPILLKALALHGKPVQADPLLTARPGFQLLYERTRPTVDGKPSKVETVEAWILDECDEAFKVTLHTSHTYETRTFSIRVLSPSGKEAFKADETYARGSKDITLSVGQDGERGVYRLSVAATGSMGQVSHPLEVAPALPVAFPLKSRLVPLPGAEYFLFVPKGASRFSLSVKPVGSGLVSAVATSPNQKTRAFSGDQPADDAPATLEVRPPPDQTDAAWKLNLDGAVSQLAFTAEGAPIAPLLFQTPYPAPQCKAFVAALKEK